MSIETIELSWVGPFKFSDFILNSKQLEGFDTPGVYLWIQNGPAGKWISYVGKTSKSLVKRQIQHYSNYIGGRYEMRAEFRYNRIKWVPDKYPDNSEVVLNYEKFIELVKDAFEYIKYVEIYLAKIKIQECDAEDLKVVERNLLYGLRPKDTDRGTGSEPKTKINIIHKNANWYTEEIKHDIRNQPNVL